LDVARADPVDRPVHSFDREHRQRKAPALEDLLVHLAVAPLDPRLGAREVDDDPAAGLSGVGDFDPTFTDLRDPLTVWSVAPKVRASDVCWGSSSKVTAKVGIERSANARVATRSFAFRRVMEASLRRCFQSSADPMRTSARDKMPG